MRNRTLHSGIDAAEEPTVSPQAAGAPPEGRGVARILALVQDPEAPIAEISRLIAGEIALLIQKMTLGGPGPEYRQRDLNDQVKAYRELQRTLTEGDLLAKRDALNMDGPKFRYVFAEMVSCFRKALKESKVDPSLSQNIMLQFGDLLTANERNWKRELAKIEQGKA